MRLVWHGERTAGAIAAELPVTFGAVSQHLRVLLDARLIVVRQQGRERYYHANKDALGPMAAALEQMWFDKLSELKRLAEAEQGRIDASHAAISPVPRARRARASKARTTQTRRRRTTE